MTATIGTILEDLHQLLSHNVIGDKQYSSRYKGFRGELSFIQCLRSRKANFISGGTFISRIPNAKPYDRSIYFSVGDEARLTEYNSFFGKISAIGFEKMYFVSYDRNHSDWKRADIMGFGVDCSVPEFRIYVFQENSGKLEYISDSADVISDNYDNVNGSRGRNHYPIFDDTKNFFIKQLSCFPDQDILDLYVSRLIFDGYIGFGKFRGIPADIDIVSIKNKKFVLCEVKEKDLSKKPPCGFGMDLHRIQDITYLATKTNLPYFYVVRHVNNQMERKFIEWKFISMEEFHKHTRTTEKIEGGSGMRSEWSSNPTKVCPYEYFKDIVK